MTQSWRWRWRLIRRSLIPCGMEDWPPALTAARRVAASRGHAAALQLLSSCCACTAGVKHRPAPLLAFFCHLPRPAADPAAPQNGKSKTVSQTVSQTARQPAKTAARQPAYPRASALQMPCKSTKIHRKQWKFSGNNENNNNSKISLTTVRYIHL